jgi:phage-related protein/predicted XRE-type DNA-binding protein
MEITTVRTKPIVWVGTSRSDLSSFSEDVKDAIGYALRIAQGGGKSVDAKPLKGHGGAGILEVVEDHEDDSYRAVYTVGSAGRIYVLQASRKESSTGIVTPEREIELSRRGGFEVAPGLEGTKGLSKKIPVEIGGGNVFADIGLANSEQRLTNADLAICVGEAIRSRRRTQIQAARILKIDRPKISRLLRGQPSGFSTERLMHFLTLLGRDVEIAVKPTSRSRRQGRLRIVARTIEGKKPPSTVKNEPRHRKKQDEGRFLI